MNQVKDTILKANHNYVEQILHPVEDVSFG